MVNSGGTLYFCRSDGYNYTGAITGAGTVAIYQGANGVSMGTGYNTSLTGFSGTTNLLSGVVYLHSANGLGSGSLNIADGANLLLWTGTTTTFSNPITLNGLGGYDGSYAKPAIYGDGGSGVFTLSGQITLAATSDIGNYGGNGDDDLQRQDHRRRRLGAGKVSPTLDDENGAVTISGATSNDYTGGTTINRGIVYLAKTGGAIAIPGNVTITFVHAGNRQDVSHPQRQQRDRPDGGHEIFRRVGVRNAVTSNCSAIVRHSAASTIPPAPA